MGERVNTIAECPIRSNCLQYQHRMTYHAEYTEY